MPYRRESVNPREHKLTPNMAKLWMILVVMNLFIVGTRACSMVPGWRRYLMEERLFMYDIVVTGTDFRHVIQGDSVNGQIVDARFKVTCVLKGDNREINETITIKAIEPRNSCQRTETEVGTTYIAGLKRSGKDYMWHEANMEEAVFAYTHDNLMKAAALCRLQNPFPPYGVTMAQSSCPAPCTSGAGYSVAQKLIVVVSFIFAGFSAAGQLHA